VRFVTHSKFFGTHEITKAIDAIAEEGADLKQKSMASALFRRYQRGAEGDSTPRARGRLTGSVPKGRPLNAEDAEKLILFEKLFFLVDNDSNGYLTRPQTFGLLSFIAVDTSYSQIDSVFNEFDVDGNGHITAEEFIELCAQLLWPLSLSLLKMATENYVASAANRTDRNQTYWCKVATQVDRVCRILFPLIYSFVMFILFALDFSDRYADQPQSIELLTDGPVPTSSGSMFSGFGWIAVEAKGWWEIFAVPIMCVTLWLVWLNWKRLKTVQKTIIAPLASVKTDESTRDLKPQSRVQLKRRLSAHDVSTSALDLMKTAGIEGVESKHSYSEPGEEEEEEHVAEAVEVKVQAAMPEANAPGLARTVQAAVAEPYRGCATPSGEANSNPATTMPKRYPAVPTSAGLQDKLAERRRRAAGWGASGAAPADPTQPSPAVPSSLEPSSPVQSFAPVLEPLPQEAVLPSPGPSTPSSAEVSLAHVVAAGGDVPALRALLQQGKHQEFSDQLTRLGFTKLGLRMAIREKLQYRV
jgi:hypothetical protein